MNLPIERYSKNEGDKEHLLSIEGRIQTSVSIFNLIVLVCVFYLFLFETGQLFLGTPLGQTLIGVSLGAAIVANAMEMFGLWHVRRERHHYDAKEACDEMTGLLNREFFEQLLGEEIRRAGRYHYPLSLCLIDLDEFRAMNEHFGKEKANELLKKFAQFIRGASRASDSIARFGPDEFCFLLPHTALKAAGKFMARLLDQGEKEVACTFSAGLSCYRIGEEKAQLLERALNALEEARRVGEHRVFCLVDYEGGRSIERY